MVNQYLSVDELVNRIAFASGETGRRIAFLIGSAASVPRKLGRPGVPNTAAILGLIEGRLARKLPSGSSYQCAFELLADERGADACNEVIRAAVLQARTSDNNNNLKEEAIEGDSAGWLIPEGLHALASVIAYFPDSLGRTILTTNFDPLIEVALARARVSWYSTSLHADGSLLYLRGTGTHVVHLHGHWWGSDTLHTPGQLTADRPQLQASLRVLLRDRTLVVLGYGGWDDVFMSAIRNISQENDVRPDILWAFHADDTTSIEREYEHVLGPLSDLHRIKRCTYYTGVDFDYLLLSVLQEKLKRRPAESAAIFFERVSLLRARKVSLPGSLGSLPGDSLGEFVKALKHFGAALPTKAALSLTYYLLPQLERQPIHAAPQPQQYEWVRWIIDRATNFAIDPQRATVSELTRQIMRLTDASRPLEKDSFDCYALEACADALCSAVALANGTCTRDGGPVWAETAVDWAASSVHGATRALRDDDLAAWGCIAGRLV